MLKPSVGAMVSMGSAVRRRRRVVLPALSRPRMRMRSSFSFSLTCVCCGFSGTAVVDLVL
jgi:hypothetical protein